MKVWTTATGDGPCAYDFKHKLTKGDRIVRLQGPTWTKDYCGECGRKYHDMPEDTGEVLDITDAPGFPTMLPLRGATHDLPFDAKMAAAGKDE